MSIETGTKMTFSEALQSLKEGNRLLRAGWNGKGMWLEVSDGEHRLLGFPKDRVHPFIIIKGADEKVAPWNPSQADLFAEDWEVWCDQCGNKGWCFVDEEKTPCGACAETRK